MDTRERFLQTLRFGMPDRIPYYELGLWHSTVERWYGEGLPEEVPQDRVFDFLGFDRLWEDVGVNFGMLPPFKERVIREGGGRKVILDSDGIEKEILTQGSETSMPHFIRFPVKTREDFEAIKQRYDPDTKWRCPRWWSDRVRCWKERDYPLKIGGFGFFWTLRKWMGFERTLTLFYDDPALIHEMLDFLADFYVRSMEKALQETDIDWAYISEDMAFKTASMISPAMFREFLMPAYRKVTDTLHKYGVEIIFVDSDGNVNELIPLWLEAGVNGILPLEVQAGMDPVALRRRYGRDLLIMGGIDKKALARGRSAIEEEVVSKIPYLIEKGGYIPMVDHTVPPDVPFENYLYYRELIRKIAEG
ncbi:MAG TPA: hypothetical protein EYP53_01070 [Candidatus Latescibacteria bacterium]|nr:hypothetical protein [Candidatus Latescibacterota bacterium]